MTLAQERLAAPGRLLAGWGRTTASRAHVTGPLPLTRLQALVAAGPARGVLARGAGRSYGDAAQNAGGSVLAPVSAPHLDLDTAAGTVRAAGSTTVTQLLDACVPHGLLLPVLPGTRHVTLGGAVASDVHGRNQRSDGSLGSWIEEIELLDGTGEVRRLAPGSDEFRATVGGLGLTGVILAVTLRLLRIRSALLTVTTRRHADLDALLAAMDTARDRYCVAWVDTSAAGRSLGRGILESADHLAGPDPASEAEGLAYRPPRSRRAPRLPVCPLTPWSVREFNGLHFRATPQDDSGLTGLAGFFHRLDAVEAWNRLPGPRGFVHYQFVVPDGAHDLLAGVLETVQRHRCPSFLGALHRFGTPGAGHLSFAQPGWALAMGLPGLPRRLGPMLAELDLRLAAAGGRVNLAQDSRLAPGTCAAMYPGLAAWREAAGRLDPAGVFQSDLSRRTGLR